MTLLGGGQSQVLGTVAGQQAPGLLWGSVLLTSPGLPRLTCMTSYGAPPGPGALSSCFHPPEIPHSSPHMRGGREPGTTVKGPGPGVGESGRAPATSSPGPGPQGSRAGPGGNCPRSCKCFIDMDQKPRAHGGEGLRGRHMGVLSRGRDAAGPCWGQPPGLPGGLGGGALPCRALLLEFLGQLGEPLP